MMWLAIAAGVIWLLMGREDTERRLRDLEDAQAELDELEFRRQMGITEREDDDE